MDALPAGLLEFLTPLGAVLLFWWLMATGRLVTRREMDKAEAQWQSEKRDLIKQSDDRLAESHQRESDWRSAFYTSEEIRANVAAQMERLNVPSSEAVARFFTVTQPSIGGADREDRDPTD